MLCCSYSSPSFLSPLPSSQVSEDVTVGTTFYALAAQDPDVAGDGALVFGVEPPVSAVNSDGRLVEGPQLEALAVSSSRQGLVH